MSDIPLVVLLTRATFTSLPPGTQPRSVSDISASPWSSCLCGLSLVVQPKNRRERDKQRAGVSSRSAPRPMRALAPRLVTGNAAQAETSSRRRKESYPSPAGLECRPGERRGEAMRGDPRADLRMLVLARLRCCKRLTPSHKFPTHQEPATPPGRFRSGKQVIPSMASIRRCGFGGALLLAGRKSLLSLEAPGALNLPRFQAS